MPLQERLDKLKADFEAKAPQEALNIMHRATEELKSAALAKRAPKVGDKAPDFALEDTEGNEVTLEELLTRGPVVLGFYRGRW